MKEKGIFTSLFRLDTPFMRFCERGADLVLLNVLYVLTSLPLISHGLAKLALFASLETLMKERKIALLKVYFKALQDKWPLGLQLALIEGSVCGICLLNLFLFYQAPGFLFQLVRLLSVSLWIFFQLLFLVVYPLAARREWKILPLFQSSFLLLGLHFPWFFLLGAAYLLFFSLAYLSGISLLASLFFLLLIGFSLEAFVRLKIIGKILSAYPNL